MCFSDNNKKSLIIFVTLPRSLSFESSVYRVSAFEGSNLTPWGNMEQLFGGRVKNCVVQLPRQFNHCSLWYCGRREITSCRREAATICPRPCTLHDAAQLQPIHALRLACGTQRALLPVAVGATNSSIVQDTVGTSYSIDLWRSRPNNKLMTASLTMYATDVRQTSDSIIA